MKIILLNFGITYTIIPPFHKLIINIPNRNIIKKWCLNHKFLFLFIFNFFDMLMLLFFVFPSSQIDEEVVLEGKKYEVCKINNTISNTIITINIIVKFLVMISILFLIYLEWERKDTFYDLRMIVFSNYSNILLMILLLIIDNIKINNYVVYYIFTYSLCMLYVLITYISFFWFKIYTSYTKER